MSRFRRDLSLTLARCLTQLQAHQTLFEHTRVTAELLLRNNKQLQMGIERVLGPIQAADTATSDESIGPLAQSARTEVAEVNDTLLSYLREVRPVIAGALSELSARPDSKTLPNERIRNSYVSADASVFQLNIRQPTRASVARSRAQLGTGTEASPP